MVETKKERPRHLGRGLQSLLSPIINAPAGTDVLIPDRQIPPNFPPDKELSSSMREIDIDKPDPGIYKYALKKAGRQPEECAFIDNRVENLQATLDLGFGKVVLFPKKDYEGNDFPAIGSLLELKSIF